jgi:hypothetical protein
VNHATLVVSPAKTEPQREGESAGDRTDRLAKLGAQRGINRQCSIGWHDECSDPEGAVCRCECHGPTAKAGRAAFVAHWAAQPAPGEPAVTLSAEQVERLARYDFQAGWDAAIAHVESTMP